MSAKEYESAIMHDANGKSVVLISFIRFEGRQNINWKEVEIYLKKYIGEHYQVDETADLIFIGSDFPTEFKGSEDTFRLKGAAAKAKANASLGIPLLVKTASNKRWQHNYKTKHGIDAQYGWYRMTSRFALPVYKPDGEVERYNIFRIEMLIRHASDGKLYLYDLVNTKKETSTPLEQ